VKKLLSVSSVARHEMTHNFDFRRLSAPEFAGGGSGSGFEFCTDFKSLIFGSCTPRGAEEKGYGLRSFAFEDWQCNLERLFDDVGKLPIVGLRQCPQALSNFGFKTETELNLVLFYCVSCFHDLYVISVIMFVNINFRVKAFFMFDVLN
jgi:hypothetical protein